MKDTPNGHIETESPHLDSLLGRLHGKLWFLAPSIATSEFGNWLFNRRSIVTQCNNKNMIEASAVVSVSSNLDFPSMKHLSSVVHIQ